MEICVAGIDLPAVSRILLQGAIQGLVAGVVVVAAHQLGRRLSNIEWQRELAARGRERKRNTPQLAVVYQHQPPLARLSGRWQGQSYLGDFFDFHIRIENSSRSARAKSVEAVLEGIWEYDGSGTPHAIEDFMPIRLRYNSKGTEFLDINPGRYIPWNLGYLPNPKIQEEWISARKFIDIAGPNKNDFRFYLDVGDFPFHQPNRFVPGKYGILVSVYAENAKRVDQHFEITWTGAWQEDIHDVLNEIVIDPVDRIE